MRLHRTACSKEEAESVCSAVLREPPWGADGQTARAMLRSKQAPRVAGAHTRYTAKPLTKTMRKAPDISNSASTPLGRQTTARRARSDRDGVKNIVNRQIGTHAVFLLSELLRLYSHETVGFST